MINGSISVRILYWCNLLTNTSQKCSYDIINMSVYEAPAKSVLIDRILTADTLKMWRK
jgi:hypothetical protein